MTAVGVARPKAHGQATTTTLIADISATKKRSCLSSAALLKIVHPKYVKTERHMTTGANTAAAESAKAWMGARLSCASSINLTILAITVPAPVAVTLTISVEN
mmetsp:Transcript_18146/g.26689  ORF Transcript_18146/g.26689 Transcript_18146/m.26689 type:complete len:103 (-) Transcript_18146:1823-2131(-)